jgi:hypothetical protein
MSEQSKDTCMEKEVFHPAAELLPRELLLHTWGHGWEECYFIGDDEEPERITLEECVWINGHIMLDSGSDADARSEWWVNHYGRKYGTRIWVGNEPPTEQQQKETHWAEELQ